MSLFDDLKGKYVICRTKNEGINCGVVEMADETGCIIKDARRIWYHRPEDRNLSWYEGVAISGLSEDSSISNTIEKKIIVEDYSLTFCSPEAEKNLREKKTHAQS